MLKKRSAPFSTHKERAAWFSERTCWPLRDAHPLALERVWHERASAPPQTDPAKWEAAGPFNIAGRVTALAVHTANSQVLYAGAAAGGVWRSRNGGESWETHWPKWANPHVGALALHPQDARVVYCATGEANLSADSYAGSGVYISRDGGDTWNMLAPARECGLPRRIGTIGVNPYAGGGQVLYLGGVTHDETMPSALYASSDGGKTWEAERFFTSRNYWCHSIAFHPDGLVFAALNTGGAQNGIWRLTDDGWEHLEMGLPASDLLGRISLAAAPSQPDTLYALAGDWRGKKFAGVFRSRNKGERWEKIGEEQFADEHQSSYNSTIAVHPEDPNFVVWGGIDLYLTRDGGKRWARATQWDADRSNPAYAHSDHHALAMPAGNLIYTGSDGGVAVSEDGGKSWSGRSRGMNTTMFYSIDVAPTDGGVFGGGCQDNGTLLAGIGAPKGEFQQVLTGDGGWMVFDPADATHVFGSSQNIHIYRHSPNAHWESPSWKEVPLPPQELTDDEQRQTSIAVMAIDPTSTARVKTIWVGSERLWRTSNYGGTWYPGSPFLDGTAISAIEIAPANPEVIFVGTAKGFIYRSRDGGQTWSGNLSGPEIPMRLVSQIRTHPKSAEKLVATVAGTGVVSRLIPHSRHYAAAMTAEETTTPINHVFYSEDGGASWRAIDGPEMPDVPYHSAAFESHSPYRLFVANDCGVWMTEDLRHWADISATLPNVVVTSLVYHYDDRMLTAATYGRGIWRLHLPVKPHAGEVRSHGADLPEPRA